MELLAFVLLFYVFIGAVFTVPAWFSLRRRARKGLLAPSDKRLECLEITMAVAFLTWPYAVQVMANHKTDYDWLAKQAMSTHVER